MGLCGFVKSPIRNIGIKRRERTRFAFLDVWLIFTEAALDGGYDCFALNKATPQKILSSPCCFAWWLDEFLGNFILFVHGNLQFGKIGFACPRYSKDPGLDLRQTFIKLKKRLAL